MTKKKTETPDTQPLQAYDDDQSTPIATTKVSHDEQTVTRKNHKPGVANHDAKADDASVEQDNERQDALEQAKADRAEHAKPNLVTATTTPEINYATRDNIVHPGPLGEALFADAVAKDLLGEDARVDIDTALVADKADDDTPVAEVLDKERNDTVLPDVHAPITARN